LWFYVILFQLVWTLTENITDPTVSLVHCTTNTTIGYFTVIFLDKPNCIFGGNLCMCLRVQSAMGTDDECRSSWRATQASALQYGECRSVQMFRLKYCSTCRRNRCCGPRRSKTLHDVQFRCPDNKLISERFMQIRSCECRATTNCPYTLQYDDDAYDAAEDDARLLRWFAFCFTLTHQQYNALYTVHNASLICLLWLWLMQVPQRNNHNSSPVFIYNWSCD